MKYQNILIKYALFHHGSFRCLYSIFVHLRDDSGNTKMKFLNIKLISLCFTFCVYIFRCDVMCGRFVTRWRSARKKSNMLVKWLLDLECLNLFFLCLVTPLYNYAFKLKINCWSFKRIKNGKEKQQIKTRRWIETKEQPLGFTSIPSSPLKLCSQAQV